VTWNQRGDRLISGGSDGRLCWWEVQSGKCLHECQAHEGTILSLKRSPDGTWLASGGDDGAIRIWDLHRGELVQTLRRDRPYERMNITGIQGLTEAQKATLRALGAVEDALENRP
jgi:WD40 repeat protein